MQSDDHTVTAATPGRKYASVSHEDQPSRDLLSLVGTYSSVKLPDDVFLVIMELQSDFGDTCGLSSLSRTCRDLRDIATRFLLRPGVTLRENKDVVSFQVFMSIRTDRRFSYFQGLSVKTGPLSPDATEALLHLLTQVTDLSRLAIHDAEGVLGSDPRLPGAFAALTCLKHLEFSATEDPDDEGCVEMLMGLKSQLVTAHLDLPSAMRSTRQFGHRRCQLVNPIRLLEHSTGTLTELSGTNFEAWTLRSDAIYPHVKRLQFKFGMFLEISRYILSFPNLSSLEFACGMSFGPGTIEVMAGTNEKSQNEVGCWESLDELAATLTDLQAIPVRCRATTLFVYASERHGTTRISLLADIVARYRPANLRLEVDSQSFRMRTLASALRRSEAASFVKTLEVHAVMRGKDRSVHMDPDEFFGLVLNTVAELPLTSFKIHLDHEQRDPATGRAATPSGECDLETKFGSWDPAEYIARTRESCPALRELAVERSCSCASSRMLLAKQFE
ncbi:hypothetical protein K466DRAFT_181705 [Polyporus arcularius HHB13444]|uniref:F-box domain-containing protein n=1 Tax=Polyporus arcularius HHB13444 TaxID=1314778 RepID=A0A5C3PSZ9_9APHY|nr:hypothetical protein K466DRAFT_181705 [Polyporus arcularius HHB13444]